jgi:RluA family pseudouridine synthase
LETSSSRKNGAACRVRIVDPYPYTHRFRVKADEAGKALVPFLLHRFPFRTREEWDERVGRGHILLNGAKPSYGHILQAGDEITHYNPLVTEPAVPDDVRILHEGDETLVVFKPAPMPVHPGGRYNRNALTSILHERGYRDLRLVHRLDAVTSGIILFARDRGSASAISRAFTDGLVDKWYYALVWGRPADDRITINRPVVRKKGYVFTCGDAPGAREAMTRFEVVSRGPSASVVRCHPVTGRTHQIRLHLREWGHPVADDPVYGPGGCDSGITLQQRGISLQSSGLSIPHLGIHHTLPVPESWSEPETWYPA